MYNFVTRIREFIVDQGCKLLTPDDEIISTHTKLEIVCKSCNSVFTQSYRDFRQHRKYQCARCSHKENGKKLSNNIEQVKSLLHPYGIELISSTYENAHAPLEMQCTCGNIYKQTLCDMRSIVRNGRVLQCPSCAKDKRTKQQTFTISEVREFVSNTGCELVTEEYTKYTDKLTIKCRLCNELFQNSLKDFKNNATYACSTCTRNNISIKEKQLFDFVKTLTEDVIENDRSVLDGKELDILIPNHQLAIEYNGVYFHTEKFNRGRSYHKDKTDACRNKEVQLLHIFENEWVNEKTKNIWKSIICSKLGKTNKIYARNCKIVDLSSKECNIFLENNHLQGKDNSKYRFGLMHDDELVMCMTFGKSRYNNKHDLELYRLSTKSNVTVVGGASKLFKHAVRLFEQMNMKSIISYADKRYSIGSIYLTLNFKYDGDTPPSYYWAKQSRLYSRIKFQKHKLKDVLPEYNPSLSETDNMHNNGYYRIWNCGHMRFVYHISTK